MAQTGISQAISWIVVSYWAHIIVSSFSIYAAARAVYNLHFHPAAKYPGPRLAAISNIWWAYQWMTGRYPMAIASVLREYGDVVRIGPNELVFVTPKAATDIYASQVKGLEYFPKADFISLGLRDQGITWERDPVKHRQKAKLLLPAFSAKSLKQKEGKLHKYIDLFIQKMKHKAEQGEEVELRRWADWLAMDIAADLGYSHELHQVEDEKQSVVLTSVWNVNLFVTVHTISKKFPLLGWMQYLAVPPSAVWSFYKAHSINRGAFNHRVQSQGKLQHVDHFDHLVSSMPPNPSQAQLDSLETICAHLSLAGSEPISSSFLCIVAFSLQYQAFHSMLVAEIRQAFNTYDEITASSVAPLNLLHAAMMEQLRVAVVGATGQPRVSPGATVDGHYIPKGVQVQYGNYAFTRDPRFFHDAYRYRPQRWLSKDHGLWDSAYANDRVNDFNPWSLGVRACPGMKLSSDEIKLIMAKVLWTFDVEIMHGQHVDFERDFRMYGMLTKPDVWVRFHPVVREV
ncbi:cytochrome P450 [Stachybotrys elegans]|uniref:Cytochrome P450 n=1 Tax=Stachybotrys elegans TaxID=80388 RepID=A0A8K0STS7_9HYPO|nr:cytochrome P450 [Stachybotrys elegans]